MWWGGDEGGGTWSFGRKGREGGFRTSPADVRWSFGSWLSWWTLSNFSKGMLCRGRVAYKSESRTVGRTLHVGK